MDLIQRANRPDNAGFAPDRFSSQLSFRSCRCFSVLHPEEGSTRRRIRRFRFYCFQVGKRVLRNYVMLRSKKMGIVL